MSYQNFTSLPPEQEQQFVVFERQSVESSKKALTLGLIAGGALGLLLIIVQLTITPTPPLHTDALDDDMGAEEATPRRTTRKAPSEATPPAPPTATEPAATATEPAPTATEPAPPPPKGATKAPPTALMGQ